MKIGRKVWVNIMGNERPVKFTYSYVDMGSIAGSDNYMLSIKKDKIFLDVGNGLYTGVIDHHQRINGLQVADKIYRSATKLLTAYPEYIDHNITDQAEVVEIVIHKSPDFDCFAAAYLAEHYISDGHFPSGYEMFADYVDMVDAGLIRLSKDNYREVYAVAYSISSILDQDLRMKRESGEVYDYNTELRNRWFQLFDLMLQWINQHQNYTLYGADIFGQDSTFEREINFVQEDYENYKTEVKDAGICERVILRLPRYDEPERLYEVEGLLFRQLPSSVLAKVWARIDDENSSGNGFLFTFIPVMLNHPYLSDPELGDIYTNRVIIATEPNSGYYLKGLAKQLEYAEIRKEELLFSQNPELMRCRDKRRPGFDQDWCCNDDPWYDGCNFNYTIVDAPRRGSLLSIEEIENLVLNYTVAKIRTCESNLILPFTIDKDFSDKIFKNPSSLLNVRITKKEINNTDYFLSYIDRYINCSIDENCNTGCNKFVIETEPLILEPVEDGSVKLSVASSTVNPYNQIIVSAIELILYKYGVGFLNLHLSYANMDESLNFKGVLWLNHCVRQSYKSIYPYLLNEISQCKLQFTKPLLYTCMEIDQSYSYKEEKREMLYKLSNCLLYEEPYANSTFVEQLLEQCFMEMDDNCCFGFSKRGGAALFTPEFHYNSMLRKHMDKQINNFKTVYFEIFLFSMHQRSSLLRLENLLFQSDGSKHHNSSNRLRRQMMNFVTQGWFSQITENEIGQEIYRRWQYVFECEKLYQEALEQIESVDEYRQARNSKLFEILSIVVFPLVFVMEILGSGLLKTKTIGPDSGIAWWYTLIIMGVTSLLTYAIFFIRNRLK